MVLSDRPAAAAAAAVVNREMVAVTQPRMRIADEGRMSVLDVYSTFSDYIVDESDFIAHMLQLRV